MRITEVVFPTLVIALPIARLNDVIRLLRIFLVELSAV
jgi:hypothetical protein